MFLLALLLAEPAAHASAESHGTAYFAGPLVQIRKDSDLFERLDWAEQPSGKDLGRIFPETPASSLYAHLSCRRFDSAGRLTGCTVVTQPYDQASQETSRRLLAVASHYRVAPSEAARLNPKLDEIHVDVMIRFAGVFNDGDCAKNDFCVSTPPPPAPPPAPGR